MESVAKPNMKNAMAAIRAAHDDADTKGIVKGVGGNSSTPCTACLDGTICYSVAKSNGHMHGRCTTSGCVCWME